MDIETLFLDYIEKNLDAIKDARDYETLKRRVYEAKVWAEEQYATIIQQPSKP
ncbi:hypothetical protein SAMN05216296_2425 [Pseudomonas pohangensis]|uniref:Uncharacterized protein n=1 Tax=Pseudomonas pohangensis TaxID=364197 RepID=A0A1H2GPA7_9PSED|nr:hypothetical protein [Pseudomonas pohangensis]SDU21188.1 hypothetical protein SAMN05216296_2425 [Pseudomonas pohangensis]